MLQGDEFKVKMIKKAVVADLEPSGE